MKKHSEHCSPDDEVGLKLHHQKTIIIIKEPDESEVNPWNDSEFYFAKPIKISPKNNELAPKIEFKETHK
jgi:hypothetical protein